MTATNNDLEFCPLPRGTWENNLGTGVLGRTYKTRAVRRTATGQLTADSDEMVLVKIVRNTGSGDLSPATGVKWKAATNQTEVDAVTAAGGYCAGIVDELIQGTVPVNAYFLIVVEGVTQGTSSGTSGSTCIFSEGDILSFSAAGRVVPTTEPANLAAVLSTVTNASVRALEANTTNQTDRRVRIMFSSRF
jgi:hypothetical protein